MNIAKELGKENLNTLLRRSDALAAVEVLFTWGIIVLSILVAIFFPHPITFLIAWILIGARQLALAILMHDFAHYSMFKSKKANQIIGQWFCAYPIFLDLEKYRIYHLQHHSHTGSDRDPDIPLVDMYPVKTKSFIRKFFRDLIGLTGIKSYFGIMLMNAGLLEYELGGAVKWIHPKPNFVAQVRNVFTNLGGPILVNISIFSLFYFSGQAWFFLLWILPMLTTNLFFLRIRSIAEHGVTPDRNNPLLNTRTTLAKWWQKLLFAPHNVHYHLEHHLLMTVPSYNLPLMHELLKKNGLLKDACIEDSYANVLKKAIND